MQQKTQARSMAYSRFPDGFRVMQGQQEYVTYIDHTSVRIWYSDEPSYYERHCHSAVEIMMPIRGEVICILPEGEIRVQADEVLIIPPNCIHDLDMREGSARYLLLFEPDNIFSMRDMQLIEGLLKTPVYLSGQPELQALIRALLLQTIECYDKKEPLWNSMCYVHLLQMYVRLGQYYMDRGLAYGETPSNMDPEIVNSARLFIEQNYMRDISLTDVAAFTGFSKYYFSRVFKQHVGASFSEYLRHKRMEEAEGRLIHTNQSIREIALSCGFGSIATFNRVFKEVRNCTPSRYREIYGDFM